MDSLGVKNMVIEDQIWQKIIDRLSGNLNMPVMKMFSVLCKIFSMILIQFKNYVLIYSRYRKDNFYVCVALLEPSSFQ